ncbi:P2X purinoceptor 7-like [Rhipicephalus sanguineus]|uniref:P2X purinoceptor 7-like n=1 Tax=Rhipicephalus sanguineus TaxID=34632 RepID=UPI0020C2E05D|nr:P2X purinoceptor 7-like [Rhipicephalus sanguineus]
MDPVLRARLQRIANVVDPYGDTPCQTTSARDEEPPSTASRDLGDDMGWCTCGLCVASANPEENVCCMELEEVFAKGNEDYITRHAYFPSICLNPGVLEAAYYAFQELGVQIEGELHKKYRFVAYRLFTKWIWRRLGRGNRVVLPACVVARIRQEFPSAVYGSMRDIDHQSRGKRQKPKEKQQKPKEKRQKPNEKRQKPRQINESTSLK